MIARMISKVLVGIILTMGVGGYVYYTKTELTIENLRTDLQTQQNIVTGFELRQLEQIETIETLERRLETTTTNLNELIARNDAIEIEMNRYLDIFARHDLTRLAAAKPGLIETRINRGTKDVFDSIENDTTDIDSVNDSRLR